MDVVVVGGGIAGATVALRLVELGARVTVLERDERFRDRVRGELMYPWGALEAQRLGVADALVSVGKELRSWTTRIQPLELWTRDLAGVPPFGAPTLTFAHAEAQEALLAAAASAGVDVRRGHSVTHVEPGDRPLVSVRGPGRRRSIVSAHLVVGADGRSSVTAATAGFMTERLPGTLVLAGAMFAGAGAPADSGHVFMRPEAGLLSLVAPLPAGRHRVYAGYHVATGRRNLSGPPALQAFQDVIVDAGTPKAWLGGAELIGPLAEFSGAETWTRPAKGRVVLVGDAAAVSDPSWGCGLSLAMRDVRVLTEALEGTDDIDEALGRYAEEHATYHDALRRQTRWMELVFRTPGSEADKIRRVAMPKIAADPRRAPDVVGQGPEGPSDDAARARFFGEA